MSQIAITPRGIGKQVGMRKVREGWTLAPTEFIVDEYTEGDILAADLISLESPGVEIPPTDEERIDAAFPQTDVARVLFEALFEIMNRVLVLEGGAPMANRSQLKVWLRNKLPQG